MYRNIAFLNGILLAIMIFFNGLQASITGPYISTLIFHAFGLLFVLIIAILKRNQLPKLKTLQPIYLLPGILGVITILLNNMCIPRIGITLTTGISLYGQLITSGLVEHFGLFGMPVSKFKKGKALGYLLITMGIIVMIFL